MISYAIITLLHRTEGDLVSANNGCDNLFHDKYREVILCEFQQELALVRQLIEIAEEGVRTKKLADTWSHEGFCLHRQGLWMDLQSQ